MAKKLPTLITIKASGLQGQVLLEGAQGRFYF